MNRRDYEKINNMFESEHFYTQTRINTLHEELKDLKEQLSAICKHTGIVVVEQKDKYTASSSSCGFAD